MKGFFSLEDLGHVVDSCPIWWTEYFNSLRESLITDGQWFIGRRKGEKKKSRRWMRLLDMRRWRIAPTCFLMQIKAVEAAAKASGGCDLV